jgi:hypothetical protein
MEWNRRDGKAMALKIEMTRNGNYKVSIIGIRISVQVKTLDEVNLAIEHYFAGHSHSFRGVKKCPFCEE